MLFEGNLDSAVVSSDGEHLALEGKQGVLIEPGVDVAGTNAVFSRTPLGWRTKSVTPPGMAGETLGVELLSPDLSQVALTSSSALNRAATNTVFEAGPVGGPYATLADLSEEGQETRFVGANGGAPGVPAFSDVLLKSPDRALLPPGREREAAEEMAPELDDLYEWTGGQLRLVNVNTEGKLLSTCGAELGNGGVSGSAINAVSADGSKVFFTSPQGPGLPSCPEPSLYMRMNGRETVEVSAPEGLSVAPSGRGRARYDGASADGSKVFFTAEGALTPNAEASPGPYLYEYDTEGPKGHRLVLVANAVASIQGEFINPGVVVSEDGSTVYYESGADIFRYETVSGKRTFVAVTSAADHTGEPSYTTPDGGFLMFVGGPTGIKVGPQGREKIEPRGLGHNRALSVRCRRWKRDVRLVRGGCRPRKG